VCTTFPTYAVRPHRHVGRTHFPSVPAPRMCTLSVGTRMQVDTGGQPSKTVGPLTHTLVESNHECVHGQADENTQACKFVLAMRACTRGLVLRRGTHAWPSRSRINMVEGQARVRRCTQPAVAVQFKTHFSEQCLMTSCSHFNHVSPCVCGCFLRDCVQCIQSICTCTRWRLSNALP
jgi:hypothetical protein